MSSRVFWSAVAIVCLVAAFAGYRLAGGPDNPQAVLAGGTWLSSARPLEPFRLTDSAGQSFTPADLTGHVSLMYFGFTHCPDECPDTLALLARVRRAAHLPRLQVLFVTVDPKRDTPAVLARYLRQFDPHFIGLTGTPAEIDAFAHSLGVAIGTTALPGGGYTFEHTMAVFLLDARGQEAGVLAPPFHARTLTTALKRLAPRLLAAR